MNKGNVIHLNDGYIFRFIQSLWFQVVHIILYYHVCMSMPLVPKIITIIPRLVRH
jgi:hypothetical protein